MFTVLFIRPVVVLDSVCTCIKTLGRVAWPSKVELARVLKKNTTTTKSYIHLGINLATPPTKNHS